MGEKYAALFIRDTLGDEGNIPSVTGAPTYSPDIICYQNDILTPFEANSTYKKYICKTFLQNDINNIYIRVKNNASYAISGKVKAFYSPITVLYTPQYWTPLETASGDTVVDVVDITGESKDIPAETVGICEKAFVLDAVEDPTKHHCMMGIVTNEDGSFIDLPENFKNDNGLWEFLRNHPQIAYNNITIKMPDERVFSLPVQYGNYDETPRKYIFNMEIMEGVETLDGAKILVQSTNAANPFSFTYIVNKNESQYACEYTVNSQMFDYLNFAIVMPNYEQTKAAIHVKNYAVNEDGDKMKPDIVLDYDVENDTDTETGTQLGDFYVYLGMGLDHVEPEVYTDKKTTELPRLKVKQRAETK